jgi:spore germination protein PF
MNSIVSSIKLDAVSSGGQVNFGDSLNISPKANSKLYMGSGSFPVGDFQFHNGWVSSANTNDSDGADETITENN